jgi:hypothetical protein
MAGKTTPDRKVPRRLRDVARTLKSANAGASWITFDMFFDDIGDLRDASAALTPHRISQLYQVAEQNVQVFAIEQLLAIKVTIPRLSFLGSVDERDFDGVQQHAFLLEIEL